MATKEKKKKNYGKVLDKEIEKMGFKKEVIAKLLKISRPTLNTRLKDGEFTERQITLLRSKNYLPEEA